MSDKPTAEQIAQIYWRLMQRWRAAKEEAKELLNVAIRALKDKP